MSGDEATTEGRGGVMYDDPNREAVGLEPAWVEGTGGSENAPETAAQSLDENDLPGRHAGLDEIAQGRGHVWSRDDLTVAEKKAELAEGGE